MTFDEHLLPPGSLMDARRVRGQVVALAARGLVTWAAVVAGLLAAASLVELLLLPGGWAGHRLALGGWLAAGAGAGAWALRRHHPRAAAGIVLMSLTGGLALHAGTIGLGVHSVALSGIVVVIAAAGLLVGVPAALGVFALGAVAVGALAAAEAAGWLAGRAGVAAMPLSNRVIGLALLGSGGLIGAWVLQRLVSRVFVQALSEQQRLAQLLMIGNDWAFEMDPKGRITYISPSFEAHTGRTVEEFMRLPAQGGPEVIDGPHWQDVRAAMRARQPYRDRVVTFRCQDGTEVHVRGNADPIFDDAGRFVGYRGASRNVTAEVLAQRAQARTQALLDRLVHTSPDAICVARQDGPILLANPRFLALVGLPEADVIGRSPVQLGLATAAEARRLEDVLHAGGPVQGFRTEIRRGDGALRDVAIAAAPFEWDGRPVAVVTMRDITDSERARIASDAILDNASVGIALVRERRFERVNPQFERIFGLQEGSLAGRSTGVMFGQPDEYEAFARRAQRAQEAGRVIDIEREVTRPDGRMIRVQLRARPIDPSRLQETGTIWVAEDVTERHRVARELEDAKRQAEAANEAKSAFLATMSHEIRTPLNGVLGLARLMQDETLAPAQRRGYQAHLVTAAEQLAGIVSDVLDLSKIEAGALDIEQIAFDLHHLVQSTFDSFAPLGQERGLAMRCEIAPDVPRRVKGDPVRVRQILANFLGNALKFTLRGSITVRASQPATGRLRLEVEDTGVGVEPAQQPRLFRPFVQADGSTTRRFGGTGLGLSICRELAERMNGTVGVRSDGRHGSVFWADLALPADAQQPPATDAVAGPRPHPLAGLRLLVAEDNPVNMLIVGTLLRRLGAEVLEVTDGHQAVSLAMAPPAPLDAVLMDLHMPTLDGLAATRQLRAQPPTATLPVYALSAAVLDNERQEATDAGMNGFIAKPVIEAELLRVLQPLADAAAAAPAGR